MNQSTQSFSRVNVEIRVISHRGEEDQAHEMFDLFGRPFWPQDWLTFADLKVCHEAPEPTSGLTCPVIPARTGHGLTLKQLVRQGCGTYANPCFVAPEGAVPTPHLLGRAWLNGHVPMALVPSDLGLEAYTRQYKDRQTGEFKTFSVNPGYEVTKADGTPVRTYIRGKWIGREVGDSGWTLLIFSEDEQDPTQVKLGFGRLRYFKEDDMVWARQSIPGWEPTPQLLDENNRPYYDIASWPIAAVPLQKLDHVLAYEILWASTRQAICQWLSQPDVAARHAKVADYTTGHGTPWYDLRADDEVFHVGAHYVPGTDELVMDGNSEYSHRPDGVGVPTWLAVEGRGEQGHIVFFTPRLMRKKTRVHRPVYNKRGEVVGRKTVEDWADVVNPKFARQPISWLKEVISCYADLNREDEVPCELLRSKVAAWMLEHIDRHGQVSREDGERAERYGRDYRLAEEDDAPPSWVPRRYADDEGNPLVENALRDGLRVLSALETLADNAETAWMRDGATRKTNHRRAKEALAEWRPRVTAQMMRALKAGGDTGSWLAAELVSQRDRCLKALGLKKRPKATAEDRIELLITDLAAVWDRLVAAYDLPDQLDPEGIDALADEFEKAVAPRLALLAEGGTRHGRVALRAVRRGCKKGLFAVRFTRLAGRVVAARKAWRGQKALEAKLGARLARHAWTPA